MQVVTCMSSVSDLVRPDYSFVAWYRRRLTGRLTETVEGVAHNALDETHFFIAELLELAFAAVPGQRAVILSNEQDEVFGNAIGHFHGFHDAVERFIVAS